MDDLVEHVVALPGREVALLAPRDGEALLSEEAFEHEEFLPYWAELWPSAVALAGAVAECDLRGTRTLELPSGKLEEGEAPADAAARELAEECGLAAEVLGAIGTFWAAPGYSTELVHVFEASGLSEADPADLDDDEDIEVERLSLVGALEALDDAAPIAAFALWLERQ